MIRRTLEPTLRRAATQFPVVTVTGPRQSGKTTLCRATFPDLPYANLEHPPTREWATEDPGGFLGHYPDGVVLDEIQRAPGLLSFIQVRVDERRRPGEFVLTGSQQLALLGHVSQSLAGRTAILNLLPLSLGELERDGRQPDNPWEAILAGGYPAIHAHGIHPSDWLAPYAAAYVERDVRQIVNVGDLERFRTFLGLCAGRAGHLLNLSSLGADAGVSHVTVRAWISVLEASFVTHRLLPLHRNVGKRLIKSPKLYFYDSGLHCHLLGIRTTEQLRLHPLRGAIFENWVVAELLKERVHRGLPPAMAFYRDRKGAEVDVLVDDAARLLAVEIKSGQTMQSEFLKNLARLERVLDAAPVPPAHVDRALVYGGDASHTRSGVRVVGWRDVPRLDPTLSDD